jgi:hypothetical protein
MGYDLRLSAKSGLWYKAGMSRAKINQSNVFSLTASSVPAGYQRQNTARQIQKQQQSRLV